MERTDFQQMIAELKEQSERRRYDALRKKYATAPDFSNMSLRDEIGVRYDLDQLKQLEKKFGVPNREAFEKSNCHMNFDGKNLSLYNNGIRLDKLDAQSGQGDYQSAQYQSVKNKGPIPEGTYYANQKQRQNITLKDAVIGSGVKILNGVGIPLNKGKWKGGPISWGIRRVWLQPDSSTNTYGRNGFSIHGGLSKGSAGCIDIPRQTEKLSNYLDGCQDTVPVYVKYPKNW